MTLFTEREILLSLLFLLTFDLNYVTQVKEIDGILQLYSIMVTFDDIHYHGV